MHSTNFTEKEARCIVVIFLHSHTLLYRENKFYLCTILSKYKNVKPFSVVTSLSVTHTRFLEQAGR